MTTPRLDDAASLARLALALGPASGLGDDQLLARFEAGDERGAALAFEALLERHGPMVLRVCRAVLRDPHDAQDAFQATFLVLVRRAGSIRDRDSLASWLHGVALRVARHARAVEARRRRLERAAIGRIGPSTTEGPGDDLDLGSKLHEAVGHLPERYRAPVVLCYLQGHTCEDAARLLAWPVGTVKSRLSRARDRLRARLSRPGLALTLPLALDGSADPRLVAPVPPRLARATAELAARFGAKSPAPVATLGAVALAEGVLPIMALAKLNYPAIALLVASGLGVASALATSRAFQVPPKPDARARAQARPPAPVAAPAPDPLIAPTTPRHLAARAGSGTALVYQLDARGGRVRDQAEAKTPEAVRKEGAARQEALKKAEDAMKANDPKALDRAFAEAKKLIDTRARPEAGPWKEADAPIRWAVVTGVVDHEAVRKSLAPERKGDPAQVDPGYVRVEVGRQALQPGGTWSDWAMTDVNKNYEVLDNLPELSRERTPAEVRPPALVDPLPFLKKGTWNGVDPEPILRLPGLELDRKPGPGVVDPRKGEVAAGRRAEPPPLVAIRSIDFTVQPATTYRYRVRLILKDPDAPNGGIRTLLGPWSEPTNDVAVP